MQVELSRRELLKLLGVSTGSGLAGAWGATSLLSIPDQIFERVVDGPHLESWKNSICTHCPGGCGIRVRLIDGIPVRVTGNPLYPVNRGGICPMAEASIEELFHPQRLRGPLKRSKKGSRAEWEAISWEEAVSTVAERLRDLSDRSVPENLFVLTRDNNDLTTALSGRFTEVFGSPNFFPIHEGEIDSLPVFLSQQLRQPPVYDLAHSEFVLNFGGDFLDEGPSPVRFNQLYADLRSRLEGARIRIVHISSFLSRTAANSTRWIPVKPGTMAALALGLAHVMIRDESYDREFIEKQTTGFSDWTDAAGKSHRGFKSLVSEEYSPERVNELTGVPARDIVELARDFAASKSSLAMFGSQAARSSNGLYTCWAIYCLNALMGNLEKTGGILFPDQMPALPFPEPEPGTTSQKRTASHGTSPLEPAENGALVHSLNRLGTSIVEAPDGAVDILVLHNVDPLFESTTREIWIGALQKVPFVVSVTPFLNESSTWADVVLPEHVLLERWEGCLKNPAVEFLHFGVQQPVVPPIYDTRNFGDILLQVGKRLGHPLTGSLPWESLESCVREYAGLLFQTGRGFVVSQRIELSWIEFLKERGWQAFDYSTPDEFWEALLERGGWWDPTDPESSSRPILQTESGKFDFYSHSLRAQSAVPEGEAAGGKHLSELRRLWKIDASDDSIFLPHFEPPRFRGEPVEFPYHLLTYQLLANRNGGGRHLSLLQENSGLISRRYWSSWIEISPQTATRLNLKENQEVDVVSPIGRLRTRVKISPGVMPDVVVMPFGLGQNLPQGRPASRLGDNPYRVMADESDLISGIASGISTRVRIEKVRPQQSFQSNGGE